MKICGIHTRLQNIIDKSGGYNINLAAKLLMNEYQLNNYEIAYEMAKNEEIRKEIEAVGIDAVVDLTRKSIRIRNQKFNSVINVFGGLK